MTITDVETRKANGVFDCDGAQIRAQFRHLATVVTIRGVINTENVDPVGEYLRRFTLGENRVVLDLSGVSKFAGAGLWLLYAFDECCRTAGMEWTLVPSTAVTTVLDDDDHDGEFAMTPSVREVLNDLSEAIIRRRRLALPLVKKTA
ncbi:MAG TPA: STAS domain-containing protein [Mycobacterium sp.]|jgi:anti-anti-sigma regulatory factor